MKEQNQENIDNKEIVTKKKNSTKKTVKSDYPLDENGNIDWLRLIPEKFIVPQDKSKKDIPISELQNHEKMILLGGWKFLLKKRGYISKHDIIHSSSNEFVSATCRITWTAHEDSDNIEQTYEASADSHLENTDGMMRKFLTANAQNRAFSRCVREYLNVNVVGKDETDKATIEEMLNHNREYGGNHIYAKSPQDSLRNLMTNKNHSLSDAITWFKSKKSKEILSPEEIDSINDWPDIPKHGCYALIHYFEEKEKSKN